MRPNARHSIFLIFLVLLNLLGTPSWSQQAPTSLQIVIVEGEGSLNNIKQRVNRDPIVQVEDENHRPIPGAAVDQERCVFDRRAAGIDDDAGALQQHGAGGLR